MTVKTIYRPELIDGLGPWMWQELDSGAWDGPHLEWQTTHKTAYTKYVTDFNVCIQAGGNHGLYPALFSQIFKTVYTFEPDWKNFHCLVNNCQFENVIKIQAALGAENKLISLNNGNEQNTGMHTINNNPGIVPQLMLDSLNIPTVNLIQLDVEGYEGEVIQGAINTITRSWPVISCEGGDRKGILASLGYVAAEQVGADVIFIKVST